MDDLLTFCNLETTYHIPEKISYTIIKTAVYKISFKLQRECSRYWLQKIGKGLQKRADPAAQHQSQRKQQTKGRKRHLWRTCPFSS